MEEEGEATTEPETTVPPITLKIRIESCRNLPEECSTLASYSYALKRLPQGEEDAEEDGEGYLKAASEEFEEPPEGTVHAYNLDTDHALPEVNEEMLYRLITAPLEIKVHARADSFR
jgi:hypothetical protein